MKKLRVGPEDEVWGVSHVSSRRGHGDRLKMAVGNRAPRARQRLDFSMTDDRMPTEAQRRMWMAQWRHAAVALAKVKAEEMARLDMKVIATQLEDASLLAIRHHPPRPSSGLIEQQRAFHSARGK